MSLKKNLGRGALGALVFAGAAIVGAPAFAADHLDGDAAVADPSSDINDVFTWMDGDKLVLAMTVNPFADADATFSSAVQFAWHVDAYPSLASSLSAGPTVTTTVQCEFDDAQMLQCWVHRDGEILDYVMGDASSEEGVASNDGTTQAFAGLRADPFFFYLTGFNDARSAVLSEVNAGNVDIATNGTACPELTTAPNGGQLGLLGDTLSAAGPTAQTLNNFRNANTLAIVLEVDSSFFVDPEASQLAVHASTHAKPE